MELKNKEYYLSLKYPIIIREIWDDDEKNFIYCAEIKELPGLKVYGDTKEEVLEDLEDAKISWIEAAIETGRDITIPAALENVSGRITLRMDKSLHIDIKEYAVDQGVSLNQGILNLVKKGLEALRFNSISDQLASILKKQETLLDQSNETIRRLNLVDQTMKEQIKYQVVDGGSEWKQRNKPLYSKGSLSIF